MCTHTSAACLQLTLSKCAWCPISFFLEADRRLSLTRSLVFALSRKMLSLFWEGGDEKIAPVDKEGENRKTFLLNTKAGLASSCFGAPKSCGGWPYIP